MMFFASIGVNLLLCLCDGLELACAHLYDFHDINRNYHTG
ncbi:hypothetical protein TRIP_B350211 [uncultured Desulfatiglans sp.]|nr:hypothetical protein TRIP_B350211 [uncultured Desulfatiglans sp.]